MTAFDTGIFGQEIARPATGSLQATLFHEPATVDWPDDGSAVDQRIARQYDPRHTPSLFAAWRYPDRPIRSDPSILPELKDGDWLGQLKFDGWRCLLELADTPTFTSRHRKPLPVSRTLVRDVCAELAHVERGTILDCEWMGRRGRQPERLIVFDVLRVGGRWLLDKPAFSRFVTLHTLVPRTWMVPYASEGYPALFASSRRDGCEGIVLKRMDSTYIGSCRACADNPDWLKVKWKEGNSGF